MRSTPRALRRPVVGILLGLAAFLAAACGGEEPGSSAGVEEAPLNAVAFLSSPGSEDLNLPFSEAVRVGNFLFLSGQIGNRPGEFALVDGGIQAETRQTLENIRAVLERHGSSLDQVVKCTVFLADIADWPAMNQVYATFFPKHPPARSALGTSGLALDARVEIECFAAMDDAC